MVLPRETKGLELAFVAGREAAVPRETGSKGERGIWICWRSSRVI